MATGTQNAATPGDEPMDEEHRNILRRCRETLVKDMEPRQVLIKMVDPLLFTKEDESIVKGSGLTREEQCEILLDILPRKGAKAYEVFKETIAKVHPHLTETILRAENQELKSELRSERQKSANLQKKLTGRQTCSRCSDSENGLHALRREMEEKTKAYKEQIRSLEETIEQETKEKNEIQRKLDKLLKGNKNTAEYVKKVMNEIRGLKDEKEELSLTVEEKTRENDLLKKKTKVDSIEIEQLKEELNEKRTKCKILEEEVTKYRSFNGRVFTPKAKHFDSPGVICALRQDKTVMVVATRSSNGPGKANDVFNRKMGKHCGTAEIEDSWWCVDIGEKHLLFPTHCSLRHGHREGKSRLCSWELQGSINGEEWKKIKTNGIYAESKHTKFVSGTWSIAGEVGGFRYFKIVQTSKHSSKGFGIYLSGIEFYGVLFRL